jgi:hypothetical protein
MDCEWATCHPDGVMLIVETANLSDSVLVKQEAHTVHTPQPTPGNLSQGSFTNWPSRRAGARYNIQMEWVSAVICDLSDAIFGTLEPNAAGTVFPVLKVASPIASHTFGART